MIDLMIRHYRTAAEISHRMLNEAREDRWDRVLALSEQYIEAVERLRNHRQLNRIDRAARRDLLTDILDNDAHIRTLASPELERLEKQLGQLKMGQNMLKAYQRHASTS